MSESRDADGLDLHLWLVITRNTGADRRPLSAEHRAYIRALREAGLIFASGPVASGVGEPSHGGATVLRVADEAEVRRLMDAEPYIRSGVRTYETLAWNVRHGDFVTA